MKRSREVSRGKTRELDAGFWEKKGPEKVYDFDAEVAAKPDDAFVPYVPTQRYAQDALVTHAKFGKGIVTGVEPQKVDVLFSDGPRKLSHGLSAPPPPRKPIPDDEPATEPVEAAPSTDQPTASAEPPTDRNPS